MSLEPPGGWSPFAGAYCPDRRVMLSMGNCRDAATYRHCKHTVASAGASEEHAVDETGHSGDAGAADGGDGAESRERTRVNGWATPDSPWSYTGSGVEADSDVPAWRRPGADTRSFPRNPAFPSSAVPVSAQPSSSIPAPAPAPAPPG